VLEAAQLEGAHGQVLDADGLFLEGELAGNLVEYVLMALFVSVCEEPGINGQLGPGGGCLQFR
jgi:hypothetical protein